MTARSIPDPWSDQAITAEQRALVLSVQRLTLRLVASVARSAAPDVRADLVQAGQLGALQASKTYDEKAYGTRFSSYATPWITYAILACLRREKRQQTLKHMVAARFLAEESDQFNVIYDTKDMNCQRLQRLSDQLVAARVAGIGMAELDPEQALIDEESRRNAHSIVREARTQMTAEAREILTAYYGEDTTLTSLAQARGVPMITVRRMHKKALDEIRAVLLEHGIEGAPPLGPGLPEDEEWP